MKYLQFYPKGIIRGISPADGFEPPTCDFLLVEDKDEPEDLHLYSVQNGKLSLRSNMEIADVLASRRAGTPQEQIAKRLAELEQEVNRMKGGKP